MKVLKIFAMLLAVASLPAIVNGQTSPNTNSTSQATAIAPPTSDSGAFATLKIQFQHSMHWMDSMMTVPISPTGPYSWEEDEAEKKIQKLFKARRQYYPYGNFHDAVEADSAWAERLGLHYGPRLRCDMGNWQPVGPVGDPEPSSSSNYVSNSNRNGRLDKITFKPGDPNTLYVASGKGGGLWKVNGTTGNAVSLNTDHISLHNGVSSIAAIPGRLIIATGQSFNPIDWSSWQWACTGIYYSNDNGQSWLMANVTDHNGQDPFAGYGNGQFHFVSDIVANPSNSNKMLMTVFTLNIIYDNNPLNYGALFSSSDGGITWAEVNDPALGNRYFRSIAYNPVNPDIVYLTSQQHLYKSTDAGQSWSDITYRLTNLNTLMPVNGDKYKSQWYRMMLTVPAQGCTAADGSHVAVVVSNYDNGQQYIIYHSSDAFSTNVTPIIPTFSQQDKIRWTTYYHDDITMTHDPDVLYMGGQIIQHSDDGGYTFTTDNAYAGVTHADHQEIAVPPYDGTNGGVVFVATDGGLWRSDDGAQTFHALDDGLMVTQFYGIATSQSDNTLVGGSQDNATIRLQPNGVWHALHVGDGNRFSAINPIDPELYAWEDNFNSPGIISYMKRTGPSTVQYTSLSTTVGIGNRPMKYKDNTLMVAVDKMYFSDNGTVSSGNTFKDALPILNQTDFISGNQAIFFDYCQSQPNVVYASTYGQWKDTHGHFVCNDPNLTQNVDYNDPNGYNKYNLFKSTDGGQTWADISPEFVGTIGLISSIAVDPINPDKVWITYSGYATNSGVNQNVYKSTDGGISWQNYSQGLPLGNTEKIIYVRGSHDDKLFLAMESGVFYRTNTMSEWECYEDGLPYTNISDIDISYCSEQLYAATFGRGIWKSNIVADPESYMPEETDIINANTTWSSSKTISGSIRVKTGATLTISGTGTTVYMPKYGRILVETGAKLVIDGAKITNECKSCEWQGIELMGNNQQPPLPQYQGSLEIKNSAILENANIAVCNFTGDNGAHGGGIIKASNSTMLNCWRMVGLNDYANYSYNYQSTTSACSFDHMHFTIDNPEMYAVHSPSDFFTSYNTAGGVSITNSDFANNIPMNEMPENKRGRAVYTLATGMKIQNCTFTGLNEGVHCEGYANLPTRTVNVFLSNFSNINYGITLKGTAYANIKGNTINNMVLNSYNNSGAYGIYLNHAHGAYVGCNNQIDGNFNGTHVGRYGIIINDSRKNASTVIDNSFTNMHVGTQTQMMNVGLNIFCNDYENNDYAWAINPQSANSWFSNQGTGCNSSDIRAGNIFKNNQKDIYSYLSYMWNYYAGNGSPYEMPNLSYGTVNVNQCNTSANSQCNDYYSCIYDWSDVIQGQALSQYSALKDDGFKERPDALRLYGHIIRGYNSLNEVPQLQSFLEAENDDRSRKLLIPMYINKGMYTQATSTIGQLKLGETERTGYNNYYNLLINLRQNNRRPDSLTPSELTMVENLAADTLEVSPYAKGYLDWWYKQNWADPIEPLPQSRGTGEILVPETPGYIATNLGNAVPNPTSSITAIDVYIGNRDAMKHPVFVIRNNMGLEMYRQALAAGENHIEVNTNSWNPGVYVYNLLLNNAVDASKKLSVAK